MTVSFFLTGMPQGAFLESLGANACMVPEHNMRYSTPPYTSAMEGSEVECHNLDIVLIKVQEHGILTDPPKFIEEKIEPLVWGGNVPFRSLTSRSTPLQVLVATAAVPELGRPFVPH